MQIIDNFRTLLTVDHIAWADGPGWLLGTFLFIVGTIVIGGLAEQAR